MSFCFHFYHCIYGCMFCTLSFKFVSCVFLLFLCLYIFIIMYVLFRTSGCYNNSLARPGRKQATATKLGIYSSYSTRSSINFSARCSNFCKPLIKIQKFIRPTTPTRQQWPPGRKKKGDLSILTCICLTAGCYSMRLHKRIQRITVTSLLCCSLCDNLDSRYLYTCTDAERGRKGT